MASASDADVPLLRRDDDPIVDPTRAGDSEGRHLGHLFQMIARNAAGENYPVARYIAINAA
jgi:hypothetical protein